jgi:Na+/melibiose symporter-like transporter
VCDAMRLDVVCMLRKAIQSYENFNLVFEQSHTHKSQTHPHKIVETIDYELGNRDFFLLIKINLTSNVGKIISQTHRIFSLGIFCNKRKYHTFICLLARLVLFSGNKEGDSHLNISFKLKTGIQ